MQTLTVFQETQQLAKMKTELVKLGLQQFLTLSVKRNDVDQEELEWSLLMVAQELQKLLQLKGLNWKIPPFQRMTAFTHSDSPLSFSYKLLLTLPEYVSWSEYDKAIKRALELRRDFWVVQIRFERIVQDWCLKYTHQGARTEIPSFVTQMKAIAAGDNLRVGNYYTEIVVSDVENVAESAVETVILIPIEK